MQQVALIFTLVGACKTDDLVEMTLDQIETHGRVYLVKIPNLGTNTHRSFTISDQYFDLVEKYRNLRPPTMPSNRFFTNYQKGKCTVQFIGKNKFTKMPKQIAEYLSLEEPDRYTGIIQARSSFPHAFSSKLSFFHFTIGHSVRRSTTTYSSTVVQKPRLRVPKSNPILARKRNVTRTSKRKANMLIKSAMDELILDHSNSESSSSMNFENVPIIEPASPAISMDSVSVAGSEISVPDQPIFDSNVDCEEDSRMKLINKYFTFENCTNVHITFFSK